MDLNSLALRGQSKRFLFLALLPPDTFHRIDYSYSGGIFIVECGTETSGHEIMGNVFLCMQHGDPSHWPQAKPDPDMLPVYRSEPPHIGLGGCSRVRLADGRKSPDASYVDNTPGIEERLKGIPTVVFEVGWTEVSNKVAHDCGRWIACSLGRTNLAIGIDIIGKEAEDGRTELAQLWCTVWELVGTDTLLECPVDEDLNRLIRTDGHFEDPEFLIDVPPATSYACISAFSPDFLEQVAAIGGPEKLESMQTCPSFVRYHAAVTERYQVNFNP